MDRDYINSSFRDPSGRVFTYHNRIYREIKQSYAEEYEKFMNSGLYRQLTETGHLIPHIEIDSEKIHKQKETYKIIKPNQINFVSYPYEWCFSQLKDAALMTLSIQKTSLDFGMTLKDASAYNIQFQGCHPIFIDTLSFESYKEGEPWIAYKQFCQHFLAPLMLCAKRDIRLSRLSQLYLDGIPLDLARFLLPSTTKFSPGAFLHLHMHSKYQERYSGDHNFQKKGNPRVEKKALFALIENLQSTVRKLKWAPTGTEWADYYIEKKHNYGESSFNAKEAIVSKYIELVKPNSAWDVGANTGIFSRLASSKGIETISMDIDPAAVERNYIQGRTEHDKKILPLIMDFTNPSPGIGWQHKERMSLIERGQADMIMALALIHHLAIGNNVPFNTIARFLSLIGKYLIIEFVPIQDSQVQIMLATRQNIFSDYDINTFRSTFLNYFDIIEESALKGSERTVFLMQSR